MTESGIPPDLPPVGHVIDDQGQLLEVVPVGHPVDPVFPPLEQCVRLRPASPEARPPQHAVRVWTNPTRQFAAAGWCWECSCGAASYGYASEEAATNDSLGHPAARPEQEESQP